MTAPRPKISFIELMSELLPWALAGMIAADIWVGDNMHAIFLGAGAGVGVGSAIASGLRRYRQAKAKKK